MTSLLVLTALAFVVFLAVMAGMCIGVMNGRPALRGSCGGLNGGGCELCGADPDAARDCARRERP